MTRPVKFLFDTEFAAEAEPKIRLVEHEAVVALARQQGQAEGYLAGERDAQGSIQRLHAGAIEAAAHALSGAAAALAALEARVEAEAIDVAVAVARKLAETLVAREPMAEIRALVADCLTNLRAAPHLVVRVNDALLEAAREDLTRLAAERGFEGRLVILAEPDTAPADARIEWATGGVTLDRADIAGRIDEAVRRYLDVPPTRTP